MKFSQLHYFHTVCKMESISRAAEALHISQPSVSEAIRRLESEFGYALLDRHGKRFALTTEGSIFYKETDKLLSYLDDFERSMKRLTEEPQQIALGLPPMIGSLLLPDILSPRDGVPTHFVLNITEAGRRELLYQLGSNELDMAFLPHDRPLDSRYCSIPITKLETVCCVSLSHPLAQRDRVVPRDLAGMPLVLFKESFFQTERIIDSFRAVGVEADILLQTSQLSTVRKLVSHNIAVGFLFRQLSDPLPDIVSIPLIPAMDVQVSLVWRSTDLLPKEHLRFIEHVRTLSAQGCFEF